MKKKGNSRNGRCRKAMRGLMAALVASAMALSLCACMGQPDIQDIPPQDRMRWQNPEGFGLSPPPSDRGRWPNPHGWGLEPETEPYRGLFY